MQIKFFSPQTCLSMRSSNFPPLQTFKNTSNSLISSPPDIAKKLNDPSSQWTCIDGLVRDDESDSSSQRMYLCELTSYARPINLRMPDILESRKQSKSFQETIIGTHFDTMSQSLSRPVPHVDKQNSIPPNLQDSFNQFPPLLVPGKKLQQTSLLNSPSLMSSMPFWSLLTVLQNMPTSYRHTLNYRQKDVQNYFETMSGKTMDYQRKSSLTDDHNSQHVSRSH